jgi:hypothetical protein
MKRGPGVFTVSKADLEKWVHEALRAHGGEAHHSVVAKHIWDHYEERLKNSGDLLYTWQYEIRWAAQRLRNAGICKPDDQTPRGVWALAERP